MKKGLAVYYLFAIAILLGFFLSIQLKSDITSPGIITISKLIAMENDVENIEVEVNNLKKSIYELKSKLNDYERSLVKVAVYTIL